MGLRHVNSLQCIFLFPHHQRSLPSGPLKADVTKPFGEPVFLPFRCGVNCLAIAYGTEEVCAWGAD